MSDPRRLPTVSVVKWDEQSIVAALVGDDADASAGAIMQSDTDSLLLASATAMNLLRAEREQLRDLLVPFAAVGRGTARGIGLEDEYIAARRALGLETVDA